MGKLISWLLKHVLLFSLHQRWPGLIPGHIVGTECSRTGFAAITLQCALGHPSRPRAPSELNMCSSKTVILLGWGTAHNEPRFHLRGGVVRGLFLQKCIVDLLQLSGQQRHEGVTTLHLWPVLLVGNMFKGPWKDLSVVVSCDHGEEPLCITGKVEEGDGFCCCPLADSGRWSWPLTSVEEGINAVRTP